MHVNRKSARDAGERLYLTGRPCRNGHDSPRYVSTGNCAACLAAARGADQATHRAAMAARFNGVRQFSYPLHPDDHAAALAFCQALDMQRGIMPTAAPVAAPAAPAGPVMLPEWLTRTRAGVPTPPPVVDADTAPPGTNPMERMMAGGKM